MTMTEKLQKQHKTIIKVAHILSFIIPNHSVFYLMATPSIEPFLDIEMTKPHKTIMNTKSTIIRNSCICFTLDSPTWSHDKNVPLGTYAKYVPISTYHCSFLQKFTLEGVKQRTIVIIFMHSYDYSSIYFAFQM